MHTVTRQTEPRITDLLFRNQIYYSPVDPDARIAYKRGKPRQLSYRTSVSVDAVRHVITYTHVDFADGRDSIYLLALVEATLCSAA